MSNSKNFCVSAVGFQGKYKCLPGMELGNRRWVYVLTIDGLPGVYVQLLEWNFKKVKGSNEEMKMGLIMSPDVYLKLIHFITDRASCWYVQEEEEASPDQRCRFFAEDIITERPNLVAKARFSYGGNQQNREGPPVRFMDLMVYEENARKQKKESTTAKFQMNRGNMEQLVFHHPNICSQVNNAASAKSGKKVAPADAPKKGRPKAAVASTSKAKKAVASVDDIFGDLAGGSDDDAAAGNSDNELGV